MGWDVEKIINHLNLMHRGLNEHFHETFFELAKTDPNRAVAGLPQFINRALSEGNNFFRGMMCGGPAPEATAPLLDTVGSVYALLEKPHRQEALESCLGFLDGLNYFNAQNNVEYINEPWFCRDIIINRPGYWRGYAEYVQRLKNITTWEDFRAKFFCDEKPLFNSWAWLGFTLREREGKEYACPSIRARFAAEYPDIVDRTKDFIAGLIYTRSLENGSEGSNAYNASLAAEFAKYPVCADELKEKIKRADWSLLPEAERKLVNNRDAR